MKKIILYFSLLPFFFACTSGYKKVSQAQSSEKNITVGFHVGNIVYMKSKIKTEPAQSGLKGVDIDAAKEGAMNAKDGKDICQALVKEGHAVEYWGGKKTAKVKKDGTWGE